MRHVVWLGLVLCASTAWASLGERPRPTGPTQRQFTARAALYWHRQEQLASGTTVHFYAARGTVFAVSWSGPFLPDLRLLLGRHFDALEAQGMRDGPGAPLVVHRDGLVIVSTGRMGAFAGRAWLPGRLPRGFDPRQLA